PPEIGLADDPDGVPRLEPFLHLAVASDAGRPLIETRCHDLRPEYARADLRRAAHGHAPAPARAKKVERAGGDRDRAVPLRDDERDPDLLRARNGDAQVVPQELSQVVIVESADDHRLDPVRDRLAKDGRGDVRAPHEDLSAARLPDRLFVERLARIRGAHAKLPARFASHAEDALDEGALRLHRDARIGMDLGDRPVDVGVHFDGDRLLAQEDLPGDLRDTFDGSLDWLYGSCHD